MCEMSLCQWVIPAASHHTFRRILKSDSTFVYVKAILHNLSSHLRQIQSSKLSRKKPQQHGAVRSPLLPALYAPSLLIRVSIATGVPVDEPLLPTHYRCKLSKRGGTWRRNTSLATLPSVCRKKVLYL